MLLPFVRELFADVEKLSAFTRVASHLREGTGRTRVSGPSPTAKALLLVLLRRHADPLIVVVNANPAAEDLVPVLRGFCELTRQPDAAIFTFISGGQRGRIQVHRTVLPV